MASICEVCGKREGEVEETVTSVLMAETLHVCEQCRQDRLSPEDVLGY